MPKDSDNFNTITITITDDTLSMVGSFKAIVEPGKKRPTLDSSAHKALVHKEYDYACFI